MCLCLGTCPQWPKLLSQQERLLFSLRWWQPLIKQDSSVSYPFSSRKAASGQASLPILLGHLELQLPALPTHWNSPKKPHQPFIGRQPGMIKEMSLMKPTFGWHLFGHCCFPQAFLTKSPLRQEICFFFRTHVSEH